ncbi:hypothetical protein HHI36_002191 [Cryptolaemus montrouzieri]|uniref:Cytochrome P450 n=1 Tax=Cryptolaemus montrouzieri TaxID=559131 RepID=A0ABD2PAJ5_9CUCU
MIETSFHESMVNQAIQETSTTFPMILMMLCSFFLVWLAKFHWDKRKLYRFAARLPGPPAYPIIGSVLSFIGGPSRVFSNILALWEAYPDFFRVWFSYRLIFSTSKPEHLEILLNNPLSLEKDHFYRFTKPIVGNGLLVAPVDIWRKHRKIINLAFGQKVLGTFVPIYAEQSKILITNLEKKVEETDFDIFPLLSAYTLDSLCESSMGIKVEAQTKSAGLGQWMDEALRITFIRMANIPYHVDFIFNFTKISRILKESLSKFHEFTGKVVKERSQLFQKKQVILQRGEEIYEEGIKRQTFLDLLLQMRGHKFTNEELRDEVDMFTIAGTDTTASTLGFCFIMLGMHQDIQQKIYEEVIETLGEDREVNCEDLPHMHLLERFIKETLRLFPVAPFIVRLTQGEINIGEHVVPPDCTIFLGIYMVHRDGKYWKDPLKFDPDRFLPEEIKKRHPYCYLPFAGGPRNCIGYKYAHMVMKTVLSMTLRKFVITTKFKSIVDMKLKANVVLRPADGYRVTVHLRE